MVVAKLLSIYFSTGSRSSLEESAKFIDLWVIRLGNSRINAENIKRSDSCLCAEWFIPVAISAFIKLRGVSASFKSNREIVKYNRTLVDKKAHRGL